MIERADPDSEHRLMTWRCERSPCDVDWDGVCERIADHRIRYLDYEGELSDSRGCVQRVSSGKVITLELEDDRLDLTILWSHRQIRYLAKRDRQNIWVFRTD